MDTHQEDHCYTCGGPLYIKGYGEYIITQGKELCICIQCVNKNNNLKSKEKENGKSS